MRCSAASYVQPSPASRSTRPSTSATRALANIFARGASSGCTTDPSCQWRQPAARQHGMLAAVLPEAIRLADLPDRGALGDGLRDVADQRYHHDGDTLRPSTRGQVSAPLREALQRAAHETVYGPEPVRRSVVFPVAQRQRQHQHPEHSGAPVDDVDRGLQLRVLIFVRPMHGSGAPRLNVAPRTGSGVPVCLARALNRRPNQKRAPR